MNMRNTFNICLSLATLAAMGCGSGEPAEPCTSSRAADGSVVIDCGAGGKATLTPGASTPGSLISSEPAAAADCPDGGTKFNAGVDADGNDTLDAAEITQSVNVCNGAAGAAGANGMDGAAGANGQDGAAGANGQDGAAGANGANGANGLGTLIDVADEAPGANCASGGQRLSYGLDTDGSGALDAAEIVATRYVCNGAAGLDGVDGVDGEAGQDGFTTLTNVSAEPAGASCANGGTKLEIGVDADFSGALSAAEIASVRYLCNGAAGAAGANGANGTDGRNTLVATAVEAAGANCATGGQRVQSGVDSNGNNTLDAAEVTSTRYVCNGAAGAAGANGRGSLVNVAAEGFGANCVAGGQRIDFGIDDNGNNTLEAGEIDGTRYVCNGVSGQFYAGQGIQQNILLSEVESRGWQRCHTSSYGASGTTVASILAGCQGTYMMLACRANGNNTLRVAAADLRSTVTTDVGTGSAANTPGTSGVSWYFNSSWSWGFFPTGEQLNRNSCDTTNPGSTNRLCWHTSGGNIDGGWRCGSSTGLNGDNTTERLILVHP